MKTLLGLDTNVLIRWLVDDGTSREQQEMAARVMREEMLHVSAITLAETIWVLTQVYRFSRAQILQLSRELLEIGNVRFESAEQFKLALGEFEKHRGDLNDHLIAAHDHQAGCSRTLTFDKIAARSRHFELLRPKHA